MCQQEFHSWNTRKNYVQARMDEAKKGYINQEGPSNEAEMIKAESR